MERESNMSTKLITMLTYNDETVKDAIEVFERCADLPCEFWGFKDIGLPVDQMVQLVEKMKDNATRLCSGGAEPSWSAKHKQFIKTMRNKWHKDQFTKCLVADMNQTLLGNYLFTYPECRTIEGSWRATLRPMFELHTMAYLVEQLGGLATDGVRNILDMVPLELHGRSPFYAGCKNDVELAKKLLSEKWEK